MKFLLVCFIIVSFNAKAQQVQCGGIISSFEGTFANSSKSTPIVTHSKGTLPEVGEMGEILVYFETKFLGAFMSGNLVVATAKVKSVSGNKITFIVLEEHSNIEINGQKKNHFLKGKQVLFNQYEYDAPFMKILLNEDSSMAASGQMACGQKIGSWNYYNGNGDISEVYALNEEGARDGTYKKFHSNGKLAYTCEYDNGEKEGTYKSWYPSGAIASKGQYDYSGERDGICEEYFESGELKSQYNESGRAYKEWFESGKLSVEGQFDYDGRRDELWKIYHENAVLAELAEYDRGKLVGEYKAWYENGELKEHRKYDWQGLKTGIWTSNYSNGTVKEVAEYKRDELDGTYTIYSENGNLHVVSNYAGGILNGLYKEYFADGKMGDPRLKAKGNFDNRVKTGVWEFYFESGNLQYSQVYQDDEPAGDFIRYSSPGIVKEKGTGMGALYVNTYKLYFDSGALQVEGSYSNLGVMDGVWITYFSDGKIGSKGAYENGVKKGKWIEHNAEGKKVKTKYK